MSSRRVTKRHINKLGRKSSTSKQKHGLHHRSLVLAGVSPGASAWLCEIGLTVLLDSNQTQEKQEKDYDDMGWNYGSFDLTNVTFKSHLAHQQRPFPASSAYKLCGGRGGPRHLIFWDIFVQPCLATQTHTVINTLLMLWAGSCALLKLADGPRDRQERRNLINKKQIMTDKDQRSFLVCLFFSTLRLWVLLFVQCLSVCFLFFHWPTGAPAAVGS